MQKPINGLPKVFMSSVNEEKLYALKSEVITLKKKVPLTKPTEEEYPDVEEEEDHEKAEDDDEEPPRLTYKQLGYVAEQYKNPMFQEVSSSYVGDYEPEHPVMRGKVTVDCGYRPGRIATWKKLKHGTYGSCDKHKY